MESVKVKVEWSGDNYVAASGEVNGLVIVTRKDVTKLREAFEEAFQFHVDGCIRDGDDLPDYIKEGKYSLVYEMQVSAILKELDGVITRKALSVKTGINVKQLGHYLQGKKEARPATRRRLLEGLRKINEEIQSFV